MEERAVCQETVTRIQTGSKDVNEGNPLGRYPFFTCARTNTSSATLWILHFFEGGRQS